MNSSSLYATISPSVGLCLSSFLRDSQSVFHLVIFSLFVTYTLNIEQSCLCFWRILPLPRLPLRTYFKLMIKQLYLEINFCIAPWDCHLHFLNFESHCTISSYTLFSLSQKIIEELECSLWVLYLLPIMFSLKRFPNLHSFRINTSIHYLSIPLL